MATFVLVHGDWHGGWCWKRVVTLLRQAGHEVFAPTLTGLGERAHLMHLMSEVIDLSTHIQDVIGVLHWEELSDVILCGHSYGGMVISGVADRVPVRLRTLVYLDAFVPEDGQCMMDFLPPDIAAHLRDEAKAKGKGFRIPPPPVEEFSKIVNARDQAWVHHRCVGHPLKSYEQRLHLTGAWKQVPKRVYIYASGQGPSGCTPFFERFQQDPAWHVVSMDCAHDMMIDMPQELTQVLSGLV
jgi:pimeloyl-ACP methyl ester carboxylesterase